MLPYISALYLQRSLRTFVCGVGLWGLFIGPAASQTAPPFPEEEVEEYRRRLALILKQHAKRSAPPAAQPARALRQKSISVPAESPHSKDANHDTPVGDSPGLAPGKETTEPSATDPPTTPEVEGPAKDNKHSPAKTEAISEAENAPIPAEEPVEEVIAQAEEIIARATVQPAGQAKPKPVVALPRQPATPRPVPQKPSLVQPTVPSVKRAVEETESKRQNSFRRRGARTRYR
jgi:hypothetical protein